MDEFEVQEHELLRLDDDLRLPWPIDGMACDVPLCNTQHFNTYRAYIKHWKNVHVQNINIFACNICNKTFNRRCHLGRHLRNVHKLKGNALATKIAETEPYTDINNQFISPNGILPRKNS